MRAILSTVVLASLGLTVHAADTTVETPGDLGLIQGRWTATAGARREIRVALEVKGQGVSVSIKTPQGLDVQVEGSLKLDEKTSPRSLTWYNFVGPGDQPLPEIAGVYKLEGDTLTVRNGGFHGARPRDFKPGDSPLADLVIFRRPGTQPAVKQAQAPGGSAAPRDPASQTQNRPTPDRGTETVLLQPRPGRS